MKDYLELTDQYYKVVLEYENYLKKYGKTYDYLNQGDGYNEEFRKSIQDYYESEYFPWRSIKGNMKTKLRQILINKNAEIFNYLRASDGVYSLLENLIRKDLLKHYKESGFDVKSDIMKNKILEESIDSTFNKQLDLSIYSKETVELHKIAKKFDMICKDLIRYYENSNTKLTDINEYYTLCYNQLVVFDNAQTAYEFYSDCYYSCEGAEQEYYTSILMGIANDFIVPDGINKCHTIAIQTGKYYNHCLLYELKENTSFSETIHFFETKLQPILEISNNYSIDFNRKIPFEDFSKDGNQNSMYNLANYYKDILNKLNMNVDIISKESSDGKYKLQIDDKFELECAAWDTFSSVISNIDIIQNELDKKNILEI